MSKWEELGIETMVTEILQAAYWPEGNVGYYFLTAYDLALEVNQRDPSVLEKLGNYPLGGKGAGGRVSLVQYLAQQLSSRINSGHITHIEKAFLYRKNLLSIHYKHGKETIESSNAGSAFDHSMYRYIKNDNVG